MASNTGTSESVKLEISTAWVDKSEDTAQTLDSNFCPTAVSQAAVVREAGGNGGFGGAKVLG